MSIVPTLETNLLHAKSRDVCADTAVLSPPEGMPVVQAPRTSVTVVVPCFNEEGALHHLRDALEELTVTLGQRYALEYLLVDDGSTDKTWDEARDLFGRWENVRFVRHAENRGIAAAIMTGLRAATADIVCSIDSDCSYDPCQLVRMIPLVEQGADLVTASPYHPQGHVAQVPGWRLALSKTASRLYRCVLRSKLFTYTSCFRVYRRGVVAPLELQSGGFVGVAELLWELDRRGARIAEAPADLRGRAGGQSKMRVLSTAWGHFKLLCRAAAARAVGRNLPLPSGERAGVRGKAAP
jgi:dolichol-phosphate mannosyltransferase